MAPQVITTTITFLFVMFIRVSQATPHASGLNVSEVMKIVMKLMFILLLLKLSFFNWWMSIIVIWSLFAFIVIVYIQDNVSWTLDYALPTIGLAILIITLAHLSIVTNCYQAVSSLVLLRSLWQLNTNSYVETT
jgi:energy-converting hydrogenase Eha subunit E